MKLARRIVSNMLTPCLRQSNWKGATRPALGGVKWRARVRERACVGADANLREPRWPLRLEG